MSTNNFSKETEIRLTEFFANIIDLKEMAKAIRQVKLYIGFKHIERMRTCLEKQY